MPKPLNLGKEAHLGEICVQRCSDRAQFFSQSIGFLHHQLINETDDAVPLGLCCCMDRHIWGENSISIGNFEALNWCTKNVPCSVIVLFPIVKMSEWEVWLRTKISPINFLPYVFLCSLFDCMWMFWGYDQRMDSGIYLWVHFQR